MIYSIQHRLRPTRYDEEGKGGYRRLDMNGKILEETQPGLNPEGYVSIPFLFQGQYYGYETGLAYNRFRYYSPELGRYISGDPIGFESGTLALHSYVEDVNGWVDVLGLKSYKQFSSRKEAFRSAKRDAGIPILQHPDKIKDPYTGQLKQYRRVKMTDRNGSAILNDKGKPIWTREYQNTRHDGSKVIIQDHSAGHNFLDGVGNQGSHFNIRPIENTRTGKLAGTLEHYNY